MPSTLNLAVAQARTLLTLPETLSALSRIAHEAADRKVDLLLFPEAYLGGYPRGCSFGTNIGARTSLGRDQFLAYAKSAVDLGDTPRGAGDEWVNRTLPVARERGEEFRGDRTREYVEKIARETGVFLVVGVVEKAGGSLYCAVIYVDPARGCIGKRRKVMPTAAERIVWAQGQPETLRAVTTVFRGVKVTLAAAVCWENYMPLLRSSLYAQGVNVYCAPTADGRESWQSLMKTVAFEGRCFVLSANQCVRKKDLPAWVNSETEQEDLGPEAGEELKGDEHLDSVKPPLGSRRKSVITKTEDNHEISWPSLKSGEKDSGMNGHHDNGFTGADGDAKSPLHFSQIPPDDETPLNGENEAGNGGHILALPLHKRKAQQSSTKDSGDKIVSRGGSCILSPSGHLIAGPVWDENESLLVITIDLDDCDRGRLDFDTSGHYSRDDSFELKVRGLDLNPPP